MKRGLLRKGKGKRLWSSKWYLKQDITLIIERFIFALFVVEVGENWLMQLPVMSNVSKSP